MLRRRLLALTAAAWICLGAPALAGEEPPKQAPEQFVDLKPVGMPIVVNGRLINYIFVLVRINLTPRADAELWRKKEPLFRDALVRAGYRTPFVAPKNYQIIDAAKLSAEMVRQGQAIAGPGVIASVVVLSQTASRRADASS